MLALRRPAPASRPRLPGRAKLRGTRAVLRSLLALGLAAVVLAGALSAGRTYLWCSMMQRSVETCCCAPDAPTAAETMREPRTEIRSACCESRDVGDLTSAVSPSPALEVPPTAPASPAPAAVLPIVTRATALVGAWAPPPRTAPVRAIRAGPRGAPDTCVRLQVFRC